MLYTYVIPPPTITSISPASGSNAGGTTVTITGSNLSSATSVAMQYSNGWFEASFSVISNTTVVFTSIGANGTGSVPVRVTTPGGTAYASFTYVTGVPTISSITPSSGSTEGGTIVTLSGTNFVNVTSVTMTFGNGVFQQNYTVIDANTLRITTRAATGGASFDIPITVTTQTGSASVYFRYVTPAPVITSISPNSGTKNGGTSVIIRGTSFTGTTSVTFGGTPATSFQVDSASQITAVSPAHSAGVASIVVSTPGGSATATFSYLSLPPVLTGITPPSGSSKGGTQVFLSGRDLTGATSVTFDGVAASFSVLSATSISANSPPHASGKIPISVITPFGTATIDYTYIAEPSSISITSGGIVNAASFSAGAVAPGSLVSIFGVFTGAAAELSTLTPWPTTLAGLSVKFNGISAPLYYASAKQINAQVPWELAGQTQASVTVSLNGEISPVQNVALNPSAPGLFYSGTAQGIITDAQSYEIISPSNPALPGVSYLTIYCTGLGAVTNQPRTGEVAPASPLSTTTTVPSITIGGVPANVEFAGLSPGFIGLYQVNVKLPAGVPTGDSVPLVLTLGGKTAPTVYVAIKTAVITDPPFITSLSITSTTKDGGATITVQGGNFTKDSRITVELNGSSVPAQTIFVDSGTLKFVAPAVVSAGRYQVRIATNVGSATVPFYYFEPLGGRWRFDLRTSLYEPGIGFGLGCSGYCNRASVVDLSQAGTLVTGIGTGFGICGTIVSLSGTIEGLAVRINYQEKTNVVTVPGGTLLTGAIDLEGKAMSGTYSSPPGGCLASDYGTWTATRVQ